MDISQTLLRVLNAELTCMYKTCELAAETTRQLHNHDGLELLLVLNGSASFFTEDAAVTLTRGDLVLIQPYAFHLCHSLQGYERIVLNLQHCAMSEVAAGIPGLYDAFYRLPINALNHIHLSENDLSRLQTYAISLEQELNQDKFEKKLAVRSLLHLILIETNRLADSSNLTLFQNTMPELITRIFSYIDTHLTEETLSVQSIADALHHNSTYITRRFRSFTGTTLQQYLIAKKVAHAQKLIRQGTSLMDACYASGFHCYSNFSRTFTQQAQISPKRYQSSCYALADRKI